MRQELRSHLTFANVVSLLALSVALGGTTYAATGGNFILGQSNSATSTTGLSAGTTGPALRATNTSTGTAASFNVAAGHPPFNVNSGTKVTNLNADKLDGKDATNWKAGDVIRTVGPLPRQGTYTSSGGKLLIMASGSGYRSSANNGGGLIGMLVKVDGTTRVVPQVLTNERDSHKAFVSDYASVSGLPAGSHTISLEAINEGACGTVNEDPGTYCTTTDASDFFNVAVIEVPF
jgi:hypothetical protein